MTSVHAFRSELRFHSNGCAVQWYTSTSRSIHRTLFEKKNEKKKTEKKLKHKKTRTQNLRVQTLILSFPMTFTASSSEYPTCSPSQHSLTVHKSLVCRSRYASIFNGCEDCGGNIGVVHLPGQSLFFFHLAFFFEKLRLDLCSSREKAPAKELPSLELNSLNSLDRSRFKRRIFT